MFGFKNNVQRSRDVRELIVTFSFEYNPTAIVAGVPSKLHQVTKTFRGEIVQVGMDDYEEVPAVKVFNHWCCDCMAQGYYDIEDVWYPTNLLRKLSREDKAFFIPL